MAKEAAVRQSVRQGATTVACLLVPRFPLACELIDRPEMWGQPVAVAHPDSPVVWSASSAAVARGISAGQRLREAIARCPTLTVIEGRPAVCDATAEAIIGALGHISPLVEPGEQGLAYIEVTGEVSAQLLACAPTGLRPRLGVGATKFVARVAAHDAPPGGVRVVADHEIAAFLAPQPVDFLPVPDEMVRRLRLVGITTLGQLAALPPTALGEQFGGEGNRAAAMVRGTDEPVRPRPAVERVIERLELPEPLVSREALLVAAVQTLGRALRQARRRGRSVRQVAVRIETERGGRWERVITLREARSDRDGLWVAVRPVLAAARIPGAVCELSVELRGLRDQRGWQGELLPARPARQERLDEGLRQLKARYGYCPVGRVVTLEPWNRIPEQQLALVDFDF